MSISLSTLLFKTKYNVIKESFQPIEKDTHAINALNVI
jgi:hypothetical protein